jgi:hypothetical protein
MGITAIWFATGSERNRTRRAVALVIFDYPFDSQYFTDVLFPSVTASITR